MPKTRLRGHPLESLVDGEDGGVLLLVGVALVAQPALEVVEARVQRGHVALRLLREALDALRFLEREEGDELLLDARVHVVLLPHAVVTAPAQARHQTPGMTSTGWTWNRNSTRRSSR